MADRDVLFVLPNGGRGGMQSQVSLIAGELARRGRGVTIAVGGGNLDSPEGVAVRELPPLSRATFARFVRALRRVSRDQIVHGHGLRLAPALAVAGASRRVVSCHGVDPTRAATASRLARWSRVPVVSCGLGPQRLLALHGVHSRVLNNALAALPSARSDEECRREFALVADVPLLVYPARFSEQKNHRGLLEALRHVRTALGDGAPEVVCIGEGPLRGEVERAAQTATRPLMRCVGYRPDAVAWLGASSFFALPSLWEGQPLVVLEALAYAKPVLTSTAVGVEDLVLQDRTGVRVTPDAFPDALATWCADPSARVTQRDARDDVLAAHRLDVVVAEYESLYRSLDGRTPIHRVIEPE